MLTVQYLILFIVTYPIVRPSIHTVYYIRIALKFMQATLYSGYKDTHDWGTYQYSKTIDIPSTNVYQAYMAILRIQYHKRRNYNIVCNHERFAELSRPSQPMIVTRAVGILKIIPTVNKTILISYSLSKLKATQRRSQHRTHHRTAPGGFLDILCVLRQVTYPNYIYRSFMQVNSEQFDFTVMIVPNRLK